MKPELEHISEVNKRQSFQFLQLTMPVFPHIWHYHPEIELTFIQNGRGIRYVGDDISTFEKGDLVLLGENLPHTWVTQGQNTGETQKAFVFQFPISLVGAFPELRHVSDFLKEAKSGFVFQDIEPEIIAQICGFGNLSPHRQLFSLFDILDQLSSQPRMSLSAGSSHSLASIEKEQTRMDRIKRFLHENSQNQLRLGEVADLMHMTPTYFCRWFKQGTGHTLITYLNKLRIENATRYLVSTDSNVSEIAFLTGFEHATHFNRIFKKEKNISPQGYRQQFRK